MLGGEALKAAGGGGLVGGEGLDGLLGLSGGEMGSEVGDVVRR